jgi:uncharacterized LabA/DUF88 family protein
MRVLILIDEKNFEQSVFSLSRERGEFRFIDFNKIKNFILEYLNNNMQYKNCDLTHVRTYLYTGEYTDNLIQKIEKSINQNLDKEEYIKELLLKSKKEQEKQKVFFKFAKSYFFFEIKSKPLQFSPSELKIFQKGVDVQLAVDLVDFTHKNIFDIAVVLSGDIDLLESVKTSKGMGKQIIIFGDSRVIAEEMKKYSDMFIDIGRFSKEELDKFTHIPEKNKEKN